jgi:hypothetical protein
MNFVREMILRPRKWPAFIPLGMALVIFLFLNQQRHDLWVILFSSALLAVSAFLYYALSRLTIRINQEGLSYRGLFSTRDLRWNDVIKTYIKYRYYGQSGSYYWYFEHSGGKRVRFSLRLFSRPQLRSIACMVMEKCPGAQVQDKILMMADGEFPWYIF